MWHSNQLQHLNRAGIPRSHLGDLYMEFLWKTAHWGHSEGFQTATRECFLWKLQRQERTGELQEMSCRCPIHHPHLEKQLQFLPCTRAALRAQGSSSALPGTEWKLPARLIHKLLTAPSAVPAVPAQTMMNTGLLPFRIINIPFP